jgi:hypothetical protein
METAFFSFRARLILPVIPERAEGANPKIQSHVMCRPWIPGPALRAVPE